MDASVPAVEIADHADALGVGRPDREVDAVGVADAQRVRAELVVDPGVVPFAEQIEIEIGDDAAVPVRIVDLVTVCRPGTSPAAGSRGSACTPSRIASNTPARMPRVHRAARRAVGQHDGHRLGAAAAWRGCTRPRSARCGPSTENGSAMSRAAAIAIDRPRSAAAITWSLPVARRRRSPAARRAARSTRAAPPRPDDRPVRRARSCRSA